MICSFKKEWVPFNNSRLIKNFLLIFLKSKQGKSSLGLIILVLFSMMILASSVFSIESATLFYDNLEDGNFTDTWENDGATSWRIDTTYHYEVYSALMTYDDGAGPANATTINAIDTTGYENIVFSYMCAGVYLTNPGEHVAIYWSDGNAWNLLWSGTTAAGIWYNRTDYLPSSADGNPNLKLKFECTQDGTYAHVCVFDEVNVSGTWSIPLIDYAPETLQNDTKINSDSIYINWTYTEPNISAIQVFLYNSTGLVNNSLFTSATNAINITNLPNEQYTYYVFINDSLNNQNQTFNRTITLDSTYPLIDYVAETKANNTFIDSNSIYINWTYIEALFNSIQVFLYNSTDLVNNSLFTSPINALNITNLPDETYTYHVFINDTTNNINLTQNRTITLDQTYPLIDYNAETLSNGLNTTTTSIFINVSVIEINEVNITFLLYNSTAEVNKTTFTDLTRNINFTNLADDNYYFNVTLRDKVNKINTTITRHITIDSSYPLISYDSETLTNNTFIDKNYIYINWTYTEASLNSIQIFLYNSTGLVNNSLFTSPINAINITDLPDETYIYYIFINDSASNINQTQNRTITLDQTYPLIDYTIGTFSNAFNSSLTNIFINVSVTEANEQNITFLLYNSTAEVNKTTFTDSTRSINFTNLPDDTYYYNVTITDKLNKKNITSDRYARIDTIYPLIDYGAETLANSSLVAKNSIYINWTYTEASLNSIQIFLYNSTGLVNNSLFTSSINAINITNLPDDTYIYHVFINDSANNINNTINRTTYLDQTNPLIEFTDGTPANSSTITINSIFINVSVEEANEVNITFLLYNASLEINKTTFTDSTRTINFTNLGDSNYICNVTITDRANNINTTQRYFTLDSHFPLIDYADETKPNNTFIDTNTIYINWTYTELSLSSIQVFLYNTTSLVNNSLYTSQVNSINISVDDLDEKYVYYIFINDTANNINKTINRTITLDQTSPLIDYSTGMQNDKLNVSASNIFINVSITEANEANITFLLYNSTAQVNLTTLTDLTHAINFTNLPDDSYSFNVTITDQVNKINYTLTRTITLDTTAPSITNVSTNPDELDDIDPNTFINVSANINDGREVSYVMMQYRGDGAYVNKTMDVLDNNLYVSNFTTGVIEGIYYYRFIMNDSLGNTVITSEYNVTSTYDFTWSLTPLIMPELSGSLNEEKSVGVITVNNTGDDTLTMTLSSNWVNPVEYNVSNPFYIYAKNKTSINLTTTLASTDSRNELSVTITASHATEIPSPISRQSNLTIVSTSGGPVMSVELVTTPNPSIEQGQTINARAKIRNIGNETTSNSTLVWGFNSNSWHNITGNMSQIYTNFTSGRIEYNNITINVTSDVAVGVYTVPLNVSCFKTNGSRCSENSETSLTFAIAVSCSNTDGVCGAGCTYLVDSDCDAPDNTTNIITTTVTTGSGSGGGSTGGGTTKVPKERIISGSIVEVVRGRDTSFIFPLHNPYSGIMKDIKVEVSGFLSQYIELGLVPNSIRSNESYDVKVNIIAPEYLSRQDFDLTFVITAIIEELKQGNISTTSEFIERRDVILAVHELSKDDAIELLNLSGIEINRLKLLNLSATKLEKLLEQSLKYIDKREYESIQDTYELIQSTVETALDINSRIEDLKLNIKGAKFRGLETPNTERLMNLAVFALLREDYTTASERIKEAEFTFNIETKGEFSIIYYVRDNPLKSSLLVILGLFLTSGSIFSIRYTKIKSELNKLGKEKVILNNLIKTAQKECFEENMISIEEYQTSLKQYENRLSAIAQREIELIALKSALFNPRLKRNEFERKKLLDLIKQAQDEYIIQGKQETRSYRDKIKNYFSRLSEIENKLAFKESQKAIKKEKHKRFFEIFKHNKKRYYKPKKRKN